MSSADENAKSDKDFDDEADQTAVDSDKADAGEDAVVLDKADKIDETSKETTASEDTAASENAERRAARQAKKESSGNDRQLSVSVGALKRIGVALVAIAAVVAIALSIFQVVQKDRELDAFSDSKAAAAHFLETFLTAMSGPNASADSLRKTVEPLSTGDFKSRIGKDATASTDFFKENRIDNLKVTVTSSMVESFDKDRATVVIAGDVSGVSAATSTPARQALLIQVEMRKVDGEWLASDVSAGPGVTVGAQQQQEGQQPTPNPTPNPTVPPTP